MTLFHRQIAVITVLAVCARAFQVCLPPTTNKLLHRSSCSEPREATVHDTTENDSHSRRSFLVKNTASVLATTFLLDSTAANAVDLKVTPLAHTFVTTSGTPKPIRENDATRFLTNARVVYLFCGGTTDLFSTVLELTAQRKAGEGPGVTPGAIYVAPNTKVAEAMATKLGLSIAAKDLIKDPVKDIPKALSGISAEGDTLIVGPLPTIQEGDQKIVMDCAAALGGLTVGGGKSGGVLSVLLDGPRQGYDMEQGSTILWYSV